MINRNKSGSDGNRALLYKINKPFRKKNKINKKSVKN